MSLPVEPGSPVEGLVDVGGHALFARCSGTGSPTVVYFAGWTDVDATRAVDIAWGIEQALGRGVRVCSYERRNTGRSDTVPGTQEPEEIIADINGLLAALGEDGPLVLLGASFGGLVASAYAVAHPDRVAGVVLLDASTAVEHDIAEQAGFTGMCAQTERDIDAWMSIERIDNCALAAWIRERRDREPAVPMVYLAAAGSEDRGTPADDVRRAWVETWSPGTWRVVDEPHWIDKSNPGLVADAVREVIAASAMP